MTKNKKSIYKLTLVAILTALSIVLSTWLKIPLISDIKLDLSYIVLTIAIMYCGTFGAMFVGGISALLGSMLFSAYGISIGWIVANLIIALIGSIVYKKTNSKIALAIAIVVGCALGLVGAKTGIECYLYEIPLLVKLPKSVVAFVSDSTCMLLGLFVEKYLPKKKA